MLEFKPMDGGSRAERGLLTCPARSRTSSTPVARCRTYGLGP